MANFIKHEPCPNCHSEDNLARYDDGSGFCFGCKYIENQEGKVIPEQTLQIIYVRKGRDGLNEEIEEIFGKEMKNPDGTEKEITYPEYVAKVNQRALLDLKAQLLVK